MMTISNSQGWVYLMRGNGREGLVRKWEKDSWGVLTKMGTNFNYLISKLNAYFPEDVTVVLVPGDKEVVIIDIHDLHNPYDGICRINWLLNRARSPYKIVGSLRDSVPAVTKAPVVSVDDHQPFTPLELEALKLFTRNKKREDLSKSDFEYLEYRLNTEFFPETVQMRVLPKHRYAITVDTENPEQIVADIQEVFDQNAIAYGMRLKNIIEVPPQPQTVTITSPETAIGVA